MTRVAIHQPDFLPYLGFFHKMRCADVFVIYDTAQYSRRGYQNRNRIKTSRGVRWITVPVKVSGIPRIDSVDVDNAQDWPRKLWRALQVNYGRAPFFDTYAKPLEELLKGKEWTRLADLNLALLGLVRKSLSIDTRLVLASSLRPIETQDPTSKLIDLTRAAGGDTYVSGPGGRDYLDTARFSDVGLEFAAYETVGYPQLWGAFVPNLSILDALFNCGPETRTLVEPRDSDSRDPASRLDATLK